MKIVKNALILGVGYVLGAQAGRERYEQLKQQATKLLQRPEVKQAGRRAQETVAQKLPGSGGQDSSSTSGQSDSSPSGTTGSTS